MARFDRDHVSLPMEFIDSMSRIDTIPGVIAHCASVLPTLLGVDRACVAFLDSKTLYATAFLPDGTEKDTATFPEADTCRFDWDMLDEVAPALVTAKAVNMRDDPILRFAAGKTSENTLLCAMTDDGQPVGFVALGVSDVAAIPDQALQWTQVICRWVAKQAVLLQQIAKNRRLAETDDLTDLANRARMKNHLETLLSVTDFHGRVVSVLHIDLDRFKEINDTHGHGTGDAVLCHVARIMQAEVAPHDLIARVGGDEFVIVAVRGKGAESARRLADRLLWKFRRPVMIEGLECQIGLSIGIAETSTPDVTADRLIADADIALYEVKRRGRNGVRPFTPKMRARMSERMELLSEMRHSIETNRFEPFFQPQVSMQNGQITGFEILARWPHPTRGLLSPKVFLDVAADSGLLRKIDDIVRGKGLVALRRLRDQGWHAPRVSFNASERTLRDPKLTQVLLYELDAIDLAPSDLVVEVGEATLVQCRDGRIAETLRRLRACGFGVELDNFGVGHAAMSHLTRLEVSGVKLDRALLSVKETGAQAIVRAAIALAKDLELTVIAEGIETNGQHAMLRGIGCDAVQGHKVCRAMNFTALVRFLTRYGQFPELRLHG